MRLVPDADDNEAELLSMTLVLTRTIYEETKDRQIRNILLRLFQYFLFMLYVTVVLYHQWQCRELMFTNRTVRTV